MRDFYSSILNVKFTASPDVTQARIGEVNFVLYAVAGYPETQKVGFDISRSDYDRIKGYVQEHSVDLAEIQTPDGDMLRFRDPAGNLILMSIV